MSLLLLLKAAGAAPTQKSASDSGTADDSAFREFTYRNDAETVQVDATLLTVANSGNTDTSNEFNIVQSGGTAAAGRTLFKTALNPLYGTSHWRNNVGTTAPAPVYFGWGANSSAGWDVSGGSVWCHAFVKFLSAGGYPTAQLPVITFLSTPGSESGIWITTTGKLRAYNTTTFGTTGTVSIPLGQYVRIDARVNPGTDVVEWRLFLDPNALNTDTPDDSDTLTDSPDAVPTLNGIVFGNFTGVGAVDLVIDEVAVDSVDWPALPGVTNVELFKTEAGTGADAVSSVALSASDSGTGADSSVAAAPVTASDSGTGADTWTRIAIATSDSGTGADTVSAKVSATTDSGTGAEGTPNIAQATSEPGSGADSSKTQQTIQPTSDITAGAWIPSTGTDLYAMVDEAVANDADYDLTTTSSTMELALASATDAGLSTDHEVTIRYEKEGTGTVDLSFSLVQGTTVLDTWSATNIADAVTELTHVLTGTVADSITNYADLRVRVAATVS